MKIDVTEQELQDHSAATIRGALEGFVGSTAVVLPGAFYLNRKWPYYRSLPLPLKAMGAAILIIPWISIQAERRGLEFEKAHWTGAGKMALERLAAEEDQKWESLSTGEKIRDWAVRHQYSIIFGSWALSMAVAGSIVARDKYQTWPQKVVQARMWAQGLTIGVLIAAGALTHRNQREVSTMRKAAADHSWKSFLEEQEREKKAQLATLHPVATS